MQKNNIERILDANINRLKEGLRVCEEICRFALNNKNLTLKLKQLRHAVDDLCVSLGGAQALVHRRNTKADVGRPIHAYEFKRDNIYDIFLANIQRVKESARVLEEFSKLTSRKAGLGFKKIRYSSYELEKKVNDAIRIR